VNFNRGLGEVYLALGDLNRAKEAFSLSMKAFEEVGDQIAVLEVQKLVESLSGTG
jgi:lipoprotein NlpI